jgi:hypothetical protein
VFSRRRLLKQDGNANLKHTTDMKEATESLPRAPKEIKLTAADEARFWKKVDKSGGPDACWNWIASKTHGYGQVNIKGLTHKAHRVAWIISNGQIPHNGSYHGVCVCHNCPSGDNPACVNPAHLFLGTSGDNNRDKENKGRGNHPQGDAHGSRLHPESRPRGEANKKAKLTAAQIIEIRALYASGGTTLKKLAAQFGVTFGVINKIVNRKIWKHI